METSAKAHNSACESDKHNEHLCFLMYDGWHFGHREEYKSLVHEAEYMCENCARTAKRAENLCAPKPL